MPIAARTIGSKVLVGAHVSAAGGSRSQHIYHQKPLTKSKIGAHNAITNSIHIGGNAFALFLKNQKQWAFKPLTDEVQTHFLSHCKDHQYGEDHHATPPIVPHGSYLVNLAHTAPDRSKQAYDSFIDDLSRCNQLGIRLYNFHPGNAAGADSRSDALKQLAKQLNRAHSDPASGKVITLLETMAAFGGNTIGAKFEELAEIISMVEKKDRVGVCLDTCHSFSAGYELRTPEGFKETMDQFDRTIGLNYLKALHVNDSKAPLGSGRDLHANIGMGFLGLRSFWNIVNEPRLWGLPFILETPVALSATHAREIKLLEELVGMDPASEKFKTMEKLLSDAGKEERDKVQAQVDKSKQKKKGKKKKAVETDDEDEED